MADNFTPGETVGVNATSTGSTASFTLAQSASYPDCLVTNAGSTTAFVGFGGPASLPSAGAVNALPVLAGETVALRKGVGVVQCSAVTLSGTTTLYFTAGQGN
jgi:hypothetical protein